MISKFLKKLFKNPNSKKLLKSISLSGKKSLLMRQINYDKFKNINQAEFKIFSQNGEDGIIDFFLYKLKIPNPLYVEIGVENYEEANTRFLYETTNSHGLIIDGTIDKENLDDELEVWKGRLKIIKDYVTPENVCPILKENGFNKNLDLFSIDIDGIDYWVLKQLPEKFSKICVAEYNPLFGSKYKITVPYINNFNRTNYHYSNLCWGMSLKALINIMEKKRFLFLGTNSFKNNAFFVLEDYFDAFRELVPDYKNEIDKYVNHEFMESRNKKKKLSYLNRNKQLQEIKNCEIINLDVSENNKTSIGELFKI